MPPAQTGRRCIPSNKRPQWRSSGLYRQGVEKANTEKEFRRQTWDLGIAFITNLSVADEQAV